MQKLKKLRKKSKKVRKLKPNIKIQESKGEKEKTRKVIQDLKIKIEETSSNPTKNPKKKKPP